MACGMKGVADRLENGGVHVARDTIEATHAGIHTVSEGHVEDTNTHYTVANQRPVTIHMRVIQAGQHQHTITTMTSATRVKSKVVVPETSTFRTVVCTV